MPYSPLFPFKHRTSDIMHRSVVTTIQSPAFSFELPSLSPASWDLILGNAQARDRLEFLGDSLIGTTIAEELCRYWPNERPGFYTIARSVLTANSTFAHLMCKVGHHDINHPVKPAGDAFETIFAAFHRERGSAVSSEYIVYYFLPLINSAAYSYQNARINAVNAQKARKEQARHRQQYQQQQCLSSTSILLGNIKARRPIKKFTMPKKQNLAKRQDTVQTASGVEATSSSLSTSDLRIFTRPVVVIDLTSDSDEETIVEIEPPHVINSNSVVITFSKLADIEADLPTSHLPPPQAGLDIAEIKKQHILRAVSLSPRQVPSKGKTGPVDYLKAEPGDLTVNDDAWILQFSQTSISSQLGSIDNPITIAD